MITKTKQGKTMLLLLFAMFLAIAATAYLLGFKDVVEKSTWSAKVIFFIGAALLVISFIKYTSHVMQHGPSTKHAQHNSLEQQS